MSFSIEWDERYKENTHMSIWPWSDLVTYVMRYARPIDKNYKVLEIGCGAGANISFFQALGVEYYAIEGSQTIVESLHKKYPELRQNIVVGDFTNNLIFADQFDLIVDRASLTHNTTISIKNSLSLIYNSLKFGGKYIGIDWFSTEHSEYLNGDQIGDIFLRSNYIKGQFANLGKIHFSDKVHLQELFSNFRFEILEHKIVKREIPENEYVFAAWNFVVVKE